MLTAGYICAVCSLLIFPPGLGIAGLVCGIMVLTKEQKVGHGIAIIVLSVTCAIIGAILGALMASK